MGGKGGVGKGDKGREMRGRWSDKGVGGGGEGERCGKGIGEEK